MDRGLDASEVSFIELAEMYAMPRGRRPRWRDGRDTLPARRRRRRYHRRDRSPSRDYLPMEVDARSAHRGIQARLFGAMVSAVITVICFMSLLLAPELTLGSTLAIGFGIGSLGLSVALTMSARREEIVHQIAGELCAEDPPAGLLNPGSSQVHLGPHQWDFSRMEDGELENARPSSRGGWTTGGD